MRILFFTQFYPPEVGATQSRMQHFARYLVNKGHQVTVITEMPNHPKGVIFPEYRRSLYRRTNEDGIDVARVWVFTSPRKSALRRILFYFTYMLLATVAGLLLIRGKYDVIFATSPPLPVVLAAAMVGWLKRRPMVMDVRDLWPAVGVTLGEVHSGVLLRVAERLELFLYRRSAVITCVTKGFMEYIKQLGVDAKKIHFLPNGTIPELFHSLPDDQTVRSQLGLKDNFVVGFCGNHGMAQGLATVLETARIMREREEVRFLFVGEGPYKQQMLDAKERDGLSNLLLLPEVPVHEIARYINAGDVMLVPLMKDEIFASFIPSKMFDYMACGKPIVLTVDGEARSILKQSGGGVYVEADNAHALAEKLSELQRHPENLQQMGEQGRKFVLSHYLRDVQAERLEGILQLLLRVQPNDVSTTI